jgi:hypothetical protein
MYKLLLILILTSAVASTYAQKSTRPKVKPQVQDTTKKDSTITVGQLNQPLTVTLTLNQWNYFLNAWDASYKYSTSTDAITVGQLRPILQGKPVVDTLILILRRELGVDKPKQDTTHK